MVVYYLIVHLDYFHFSWLNVSLSRFGIYDSCGMIHAYLAYAIISSKIELVGQGMNWTCVVSHKKSFLSYPIAAYSFGALLRNRIIHSRESRSKPITWILSIMWLIFQSLPTLLGSSTWILSRSYNNSNHLKWNSKKISRLKVRQSGEPCMIGSLLGFRWKSLSLLDCCFAFLAIFCMSSKGNVLWLPESKSFLWLIQYEKCWVINMTHIASGSQWTILFGRMVSGFGIGMEGAVLGTIKITWYHLITNI